jgi:Zn-dependent metalloprotease
MQQRSTYVAMRFCSLTLVWLVSLGSSIASAGPPSPSTKLNQLRVHPLPSAPRTHARAGTSSSDPDARADALAARLAQTLTRIRATAQGSATGSTSTQAVAGTPRGAMSVRWRHRVGTPMQIRGAVLEPAGPEGGAAGAAGDEATARRFLAAHRHLLRLDDPDRELVTQGYGTDHLDRRHVRFAQVYGGLPVWPAELNVHLDARGNVDLMEGGFVPTPRHLRLTPTVTAADAIDAARQAVPGGGAAVASIPALIVYAPLSRRARLAWKLDLDVSLTARWAVVVDARSGRLLTAFNQIESQSVDGSGVDLFGTQQPLRVFRHTDNQFYMIDTSKPMFDPTSQLPDLNTTRGAITILDAFNEPPTSDVQTLPELFYVTSTSATQWSPADAVSAAVGLSQTFDYYRTRHDRNSLDGQGGSLIGVVRVGQNFFNAFWNGSFMVFGDADLFAGSLDVIAHELTHGVTDYTANLIYRDQSGAMNEAFSDIFGEAVEAFVRGDNDWLIGSEMNAPLRSMEDPGRFGDPATMSDFVSTDQDNGGVHTNSGIFNHAYYQLAEGLNNAIGRVAAERIFYRALSVHLFANAQLIDGRLAAVASAEELFGANSPQARATRDAFDAVEIFDGRGTPEPSPFPPVTGVDATLALFFDSFTENYQLSRRESSLGDPNDGVQLIDPPVDAAKPSVTGDGEIAVYVDTNDDVCFVFTDGTPFDPESGSIETCLGVNGINSVGMAPDGDHYGFVLLDDDGFPDNFIHVIDLSGPEPVTRSFELHAPVEDGGLIDSVTQADAMDFTADNRFVIYDALNHMRLADGTEVEAWSIYAIDLDSEDTLAIVPPIAGVDIGFPSLSQTSDNFLVFDAFDNEAGQSTVMTANLSSGDRREIATVDGYSAPGYNGDDSAIVYSQNDDDTPTEFSLLRQPLAGDRLTPSGAPSLWLSDADYGVIYRRGTFTGPTSPTPTRPIPTPTRTPTRGPTPTLGPCFGDCDRNGRVLVNELVLGVNIALNRGQLSACGSFDSNNDRLVRVNELVAAVNAALRGCRAG